MKKKHILIVDDDPDILNVMRDTLQLNEAYEVISFATANEVLEYISPENEYPTPDLFVLDIWLPDIDGDELALMIRENNSTSTSPIILISAVLDARTVAEEVGANDYLSKPFLIEELEFKISQLVLA